MMNGLFMQFPYNNNKRRTRYYFVVFYFDVKATSVDRCNNIYELWRVTRVMPIIIFFNLQLYKTY